MAKRAVPDEGRRRAINSKITNDVRAALEKAAAASGRTLSLEIETRLQSSFDLEADLALQEEIKSEMRGSIAALEGRIALMEEREAVLWPDESTRVLGRSFAMTLTAVEHATGQYWRESPMAAPIVANVVRRMVDGCSRSGSLASDLFDRDRITAISTAVAQTMLDRLAKTIPPLPPLQFQDDPANWTNHAHTAMTFRDKATGKLLQVVRGPEFVLADPQAERGLGPDLEAAIERFRPIRDTINAETFIVHALTDGSTSWERLSGTGGKVHVPVGQDAPPPEPAASDDPNGPPVRLIGEEAAGADAHNWRRARGSLPPEIGDRALFDEVMGDPRPDGDNTPPAPAKASAPKPRRKAKAPA